MLVYGDPQYAISADSFAGALKRRLKSVDPRCTDDIRALLIQAGQFEQGLFDASDSGTLQRQKDLRTAMGLTDAAARALLGPSEANRVLPAIQEFVDRLESLGDLQLLVKIPEGYEFYGLYPEQYLATARGWLQHSTSKYVFVIGVRSIGTSLSALVCTALNAAGRFAERITVRPTGHPFRRQVAIRKLVPAKWDSVIIVDEGPGLSGSSVSAVCTALEAQGFSTKQFHFFPGHNHGPGKSSSPEIRTWWTNTPQWFTAATDVPEALLEESAKLIADWGDSPRIEDAAGGAWRALLGLAEEEWPLAMLPFERPKYLCSSGHRPKALWKFAGLGALYQSGYTGAETAILRMEAVAKEGFGPAPLGTSRGFVAMPWIEGGPLVASEGTNPSVFERLMQYLFCFVGRPLGKHEAVQARDRLTLMIETNTREALGHKWAALAKARAETHRELSVMETYVDGHLAPHEWLRTTSGALLKMDCFGHDADHTWIGKQSLLWDVAGLVTEWGLSPKHIESIISAFKRRGVAIQSGAVDFYRLAYSAFRAGQCAVCAEIVADTRDKARLHSGRQRYSRVLLDLLTL